MDEFNGERIFVDTNILYYSINPQAVSGAAARRQLISLSAQSELCISSQVLREYANVVLHMARIQKLDWNLTHQNLQ